MFAAATYSPIVWPYSAAVLPLDGLGLIRATGADAQAFLQSQLTNDAKLLTPAQGQLSGYCSPKGRLLAAFTIFVLGTDDYALALPRALVAPTFKRLKMFVLRSKLDLSDASSTLPAMGLMGHEAAAALAHIGIAAPLGDYAVAGFDGGWVLCRPGPLPRYELWGSPEKLAALADTLALPSARPEDWALAEVLAGIPQVQVETTETFVPQTIDLDSAGGLSFTKGCYPGQEIVARVHYLGRVKQRLHLARCAASAAPGTPVFEADGSGQSVGELMAAAGDGQNHYLAVALQLAHGSSTLRLGAPDGPALSTPQRLHP